MNSVGNWFLSLGEQISKIAYIEPVDDNDGEAYGKANTVADEAAVADNRVEEESTKVNSNETGVAKESSSPDVSQTAMDTAKVFGSKHTLCLPVAVLSLYLVHVTLGCVACIPYTICNVLHVHKKAVQLYVL